MRWIGNALIAASVLGFVVLGLLALEIEPPWISQARPAPVAVAQAGVAVPPAAPPRAPEPPPTAAVPGADRHLRPVATPTARPAATAAPTATLPPRLAIDRVAIPSIGLDAEAVPAALVEKAGALTWEVPAHKAGHADGTAGAGDLGNAVMLGHVDSRNAGNVFKDLDKVALGDRITVEGGGSAFTYEVVEIKTVDRMDTSMVQTTRTASLTLFTCTGVWLPTIWDYTERLVVRANLVEVGIGGGGKVGR